MVQIKGKVYKFGDDIDTDQIIPARYLNTSDPAELAAHCMEDADPSFAGRVEPGAVIVAGKTSAAAPPGACADSYQGCRCSPVSSLPPLPASFTAMRSISAFRFWSARKRRKLLRRAIK